MYQLSIPATDNIEIQSKLDDLACGNKRLLSLSKDPTMDTSKKASAMGRVIALMYDKNSFKKLGEILHLCERKQAQLLMEACLWQFCKGNDMPMEFFLDFWEISADTLFTYAKREYIYHINPDLRNSGGIDGPSSLFLFHLKKALS